MAQLVKSFRLVLTGSAQPLNSTQLLTESFIVRSETANAGNVYIGDSTVTTGQGMYIKPDEANVKEARTSGRGGVQQFDLSKVYVVGTAADAVRVEYLYNE